MTYLYVWELTDACSKTFIPNPYKLVGDLHDASASPFLQIAGLERGVWRGKEGRLLQPQQTFIRLSRRRDTTSCPLFLRLAARLCQRPTTPIDKRVLTHRTLGRFLEPLLRCSLMRDITFSQVQLRTAGRTFPALQSPGARGRVGRCSCSFPSPIVFSLHPTSKKPRSKQDQRAPWAAITATVGHSRSGYGYESGVETARPSSLEVIQRRFCDGGVEQRVEEKRIRDKNPF